MHTTRMDNDKIIINAVIHITTHVSGKAHITRQLVTTECQHRTAHKQKFHEISHGTHTIVWVERDARERKNRGREIGRGEGGKWGRWE